MAILRPRPIGATATIPQPQPQPRPLSRQHKSGYELRPLSPSSSPSPSHSHSKRKPYPSPSPSPEKQQKRPSRKKKKPTTAITTTTTTTCTTTTLKEPSPPQPQPPSPSSKDPKAFTEFLTRLRRGQEPTYTIGNDSDYIRIPDEYLLHRPLGSNPTQIKHQLFQQVYLHTHNHSHDPSLTYLDLSSIILTTFDSQADMYNHIGFSALPSKALERTYKSLDESCFGKNWIVSDFMSKPPPPGAHTPARTLKLKVGLPIMLLSDVMGLSAGTRVLIVGLEDDVIHASTTITNDSVGLSTSENRVVQIYRNEFIDSTRCGPVVSYYRRQFPVKRAVALTIDDLPEGVMFKGGVGVDLTYPFKSPGQLHSALSRCLDCQRLKVFIHNGLVPGQHGRHTRNVVWK